MKELIDSIKNPLWRAFTWRVINTFNAFILPSIVTSAGLYIEANDLPIAFTSFLSLDLLNFVGGAVIFTIIGASITGVGKVNRIK